jgi:hypothetical protein
MKSKIIKSPDSKPATVVSLQQKILKLQRQIDGFKNKILKLENKSLKQEQKIIKLETEIKKLKEPKTGGFIDLSPYRNDFSQISNMGHDEPPKK